MISDYPYLEEFRIIIIDDDSSLRIDEWTIGILSCSEIDLNILLHLNPGQS